MTELGKSVFDAIEFLTEFNKDVSRLVKTVEDKMNNEGLAHIYGSTAFWNRSTVYYSSTSWMPRWVARLYAEKASDRAKGDIRSLWFACFNVYFTPKSIREPVAVWGIGIQETKKSLGNPTESLLISNDGPDFLVTVPIEQWESVENLPKQLSSFKYQAKLVVELSNAQMVEEIVVQPILAEIQKPKSA